MSQRAWHRVMEGLSHVTACLAPCDMSRITACMAPRDANPSYISPFQLFPSQHQLGACLVVELRGDVQALGLGQLVAGAKFTFCILVFNQRKIAPVNFHPCRLHLSDGFHYMKMSQRAWHRVMWKTLIQILVSILTAIGTTLGVTSCMGYGPIAML